MAVVTCVIEACAQSERARCKKKKKKKDIISSQERDLTALLHEILTDVHFSMPGLSAIIFLRDNDRHFDEVDCNVQTYTSIYILYTTLHTIQQIYTSIITRAVQC